ncbi:MAG: hypothetical protein K1X94_20370 [Sandaracinaceae bacterium]|nr:hypothetical protein [Sandaracinaceae bacterium]
MTRSPTQLDWARAQARAASHFAWPEVRSAHESADPHVAHLAADVARVEHESEARACPTCGCAPASLVWVSIGTSDASWTQGDERCGWLTLCARCMAQVDFFLDTDMVNERRRGNW